MRIAIYLLVALGVAALSVYGLQWSLKTENELARYSPSQIDIGFAQFMSVHHQQAIAMSQMMLDGKPTGLAPLARSIATAQLVELGEMRGWLKLWAQPLFPESDNMAWMLLSDRPLDAELTQYLIDCRSAPGGMPGLASMEELNQLRQLEGRARDELFLQLMLEHHEGGVPMARFSAAEASLEPVRRLAGQMYLEQSKEINQIRSMLAAVALADSQTKLEPRQ